MDKSMINQNYTHYANWVYQIIKQKSGIRILNPYTEYMREMFDHNIQPDTAADNMMNAHGFQVID